MKHLSYRLIVIVLFLFISENISCKSEAAPMPEKNTGKERSMPSVDSDTNIIMHDTKRTFGYLLV